MNTVTSRREPISHPAKGGHEEVLLKDHLEDVAGRMEAIVPAQAEGPTGRPLREMLHPIARLHDFGKLAPGFQAYVGNGTARPDAPTHHSPLGALAAYHVLLANQHPRVERLAGFLAVARHHGRLPDASTYLRRQLEPASRGFIRRYRDDVTRQTRSIDDESPHLAAILLENASGDTTSWEAFYSQVKSGALQDSILEDASTGQSPFQSLRGGSRALPAGLYETALQAWSSLVLADKTSAAGIPFCSLPIEPPPTTPVKDHIEGLSKDRPQDPKAARVHELRVQAHQEVLASIEGFVKAGAKVANLTLPTGLGKTLTGLEAAYRIRDLGDREVPVVYALPFTSIIDQVGDTLRNDIYQAGPRDRRITLHHHLSETRVQLGEEEPTDAEARLERMLGTSWRSGLIVTTFVQLFESLAGPKNTASMKLPALHEAVIILDEPQALPHRWWKLVRRLIRLLCEGYNARVLSMTATPPRILEGGLYDPVDLVEDPSRYFTKLNRVEFLFHPSSKAFVAGEQERIGHARASRTLLAEGEASSTLAVCNTIESAQTLTGDLRDAQEAYVALETVHAGLLEEDAGHDPKRLALAVQRARGEDACVFAHLTTRLRPKDRLVRIKALKHLLEEGVPVIVVSTQLIEAGVDLSFQRVVRDIAPLSNIVQAAGRCNRSMEADRGQVYVWWLDAPGERSLPPAQAVYARTGENLLAPTARALGEALGSPPADRLPEPEVAHGAVERYYELLKARGPGSSELVEFLENANAEALGAESMIDQRQAAEVLVLRSSTEASKLNEFREAWSTGDTARAMSLLRELRACQVSIPVYDPKGETAKKLGQLPRVHADAELRYLDTTQDRYRSYLDPETGEVLVPESTVRTRFL